jgi:uncharacterized membrane protein YgaE (UPF0421/DUF939 family)
MSRTTHTLRTAAGAGLIAAGAVLLLLPGPGLAMIAAGITVLPDGRRKLARTRELIEPRARRFAEALRARAAKRGVGQ